MEALRRIKANTVEKRLLNGKGNPAFGLSFYILNKKGEYAGVSMYQSQLRGLHRKRSRDAALRAAARGQAPPTEPAALFVHGKGGRISPAAFRLKRSPRYLIGIVQK